MNDDSQVEIRLYKAGDSGRVRALTIEGFDGLSIDQATDRQFGVGTYPSWDERKWMGTNRQLEAHPEHAFVAEVAGEVMGYITTDINHPLRSGRILDMAVDARLRRRGIGTRLIAHAIAYFRSLDLELARIETLEHNGAGRALYPKFGFSEVARQIHFAMRLDIDSDAAHGEVARGD